jgi:hypothetical protein
MTQLYRDWDGGDPPRLLYVGVANAASWRQMAHARNSGWMKDVRTITVSAPYRTRAEALAAEAEAIRTENPKFNQQHNPNPIKPPIADAHQGRELLKRLKAGQRSAGAVESDFEKRAADAIEAMRPRPPPENEKD